LDFCRAIFFAGLFAGSFAGPTSAKAFVPQEAPQKKLNGTNPKPKLEKRGWKNCRIAKTGESVENMLLKSIVGARPTAAPGNGGKR